MSDPVTTIATTPGHSTRFFYGNAATQSTSTSWFEIAGITEITPPELEADDIDVSSMLSPEQHKEFAAGWADAGEADLVLQYEKAAATTIYGLFRQPKVFKIQFEDGSTWVFSGYLKKFGNEVDREGIVTQKVTAKVSGKPVFTAAA